MGRKMKRRKKRGRGKEEKRNETENYHKGNRESTVTSHTIVKFMGY